MATHDLRQGKAQLGRLEGIQWHCSTRFPTSMLALDHWAIGCCSACAAALSSLRGRGQTLKATLKCTPKVVAVMHNDLHGLLRSLCHVWLL